MTIQQIYDKFATLQTSSDKLFFIDELLKLSIIFSPSLIRLDPPVKITILDAFFEEYSLRDRILS